MKPETSGTQLKVLLVDDVGIFLVTYRRMFERVGIKDVTAAKNGKEAVDLHRINGQSFDLILMDKDMPIMNGIQATKELRSTGISSKIIGVSSSSREESNVQEFVEAGLDDYYMKPLTEEMLREILDKIKP
ncbi:hypothetical protein JHK82_053874 [Glycine max]|nr:hypothetical protein JHK87_053785 [Glycine soja]KAG5086477.1 hypothetical protein JHK82_053874 [Glycine max]